MTNFTFLDGAIVLLYLAATITAGVLVRRYVGKVEHFLVAGREMNLYLGIASMAATEFGIVTCMYTAQNGYDKGFSGAMPGLLLAGAMLLVGITGFAIKPLRRAGVITIPEMFTKVYGEKIRWMSGVVIVVGGLLNMGVFLRTGGEFLVTVVGFNVGYLEVTMTLLLAGVALYTIMGGMISVLITDYLQFIIMSLGLLVVTILIFTQIGWTTLTDAIQSNYGEGGFNPFLHPDMGWDYMIFNALVALSIVLTWQTIIQRVLAAKSSEVGQKIYKGTSMFFVCRFILPGLWGIAALAVLTPDQVGDNTLLAMPKFLADFLPFGLMGVLIAAMLAADMSTDAAYMLSWGSVIYNDIMAPIHKGKWSEKKGLVVNRIIVGCIGIFLLIYGLWYPLKGDLWTYLTVTGSIYLASMSVLLIACCYWPRANRYGAAAAITIGAVMPVSYLIFEQVPATANFVGHVIGPYIWGIITYAAAAVGMIAGSLLKKSPLAGDREEA